MQPARIADLLEPFHAASPANDKRTTANEALYRRISTYIDILLRWNARINLTAIRDPEQIVTRHFGESLFAARHLFPNPPAEEMDAHVGTAALGCPAERSSAGALASEGRANHQRRPADDGFTLADLGSGAGFPGIPIKLWAAHLALTLIESNQKKVAFLREIVRALTLTSVNVFPGRAHEFLHPQPGPRRGFDLVTLRAVERFTNILPVAASLVSPGGRLALLIGASQLDAAQSTLPSITWDRPIGVPVSHARTLLIGHAPLGSKV
jgi:16S rRNA (guanine527-N7)-methyltransferase